MGIIKMVWRGDAGLLVSYWVFGIFVGALLGIPLGMVTPGSLPAVAMAAVFGAYLWWVNMGIWRASNKYDGPVIWAGLAKLAVVVGMLFVGVIAFSVVSAVSSRSWNHGLQPLTGQLDGEKKASCSDIDAFLEQCEK